MERDWTAVIERLRSETLIKVTQAARLVPSDSRRGYCSANALVNWILHGKRGVFLDGLRMTGKAWWTSAMAINRFLAELSSVEAKRRERPAQTIIQGERDRMRRHQEAMAQLRGK